MSKSHIFVFAFFACCTLAVSFSATEPDWEYMVIKIECSSSDKNAIKTELRPVRLEGGVYAVNGTFELRTDLNEEYLVDARLLYSTNGGGHWTSTPFELKSCSFDKFMNTAYKDYLMKDLSVCAGTPEFGDEEWKAPLKADTFLVKNCLINNSNLPTHLRPGFYKVVGKATGPSTNIVIEITVKVDRK